MTVYQVVLNGLQLNQKMLTVLYYDAAGEAGFDWSALADAIRIEMVLNLQDQLTAQTSYSGITYREDILGSVGVTVPFTSGDLVGTGAGEDNMTQGACIVRKLTGSQVRPSKGRVYQGGLSMGALNEFGLWPTSVQTALTDFWNEVVSFSFSGPVTFDMVLKASNPSAPNTQAYTNVTEMKAIGNPATQHRRRIGVGS